MSRRAGAVRPTGVNGFRIGEMPPRAPASGVKSRSGASSSTFHEEAKDLVCMFMAYHKAVYQAGARNSPKQIW